jgi:hypothetical protein
VSVSILRCVGLIFGFGGVVSCAGGRQPLPDTTHNTPQQSISQKELGTLPDDGNVMPKHVAPTIHH